MHRGLFCFAVSLLGGESGWREATAYIEGDPGVSAVGWEFIRDA